MIKEFLDVFPEELPGLPPEKEVDLSIEVIQGTTPISRAPYRMALLTDFVIDQIVQTKL